MAKMTIEKILLTDDIADLAAPFMSGEFVPGPMILIGLDADSIIRVRYKISSLPELYGMLALAADTVRQMIGRLDNV